jgi:hypothetical protein
MYIAETQIVHMCVYVCQLIRQTVISRKGQTGRPMDDSQQYSTDQLKLDNEPHEGLDTKMDA